MNLKKLKKEIRKSKSAFNKTLKESIESDLMDIDEIKTMKSLVPSFNRIIILKGWSGFNDGDAQYSTYSGPYGNNDDNGLEFFSANDYFETLDDDAGAAEVLLTETIEMFKESYDYCRACNEYDYEYDWNKSYEPSDDEVKSVVLLNDADRDQFVDLYGKVVNAISDSIGEIMIQNEYYTLDC